MDITDDMVERAAVWLDVNIRKTVGPPECWEVRKVSKGNIRKALEAALNPEPEIPVSERMIDVGVTALRDGYDYRISAAEVYRAMESQRRKEECLGPMPTESMPNTVWDGTGPGGA